MDLHLTYVGVAPLKIMDLYEFMLRFAPTTFSRPVRTYSRLGRHLVSFQQLTERQERSQEMGCTWGVTGFIHSVQPHAEGAPKGAVTALGLTPKVKQPQPPGTQLAWLYWVRVAILDLDAKKWLKFSSECPRDT